MLCLEGARALGQAPQGSDPSTKPARAWEAFGQCSQTPGLIFLGGPFGTQGLDLMILESPFQLGIFHGSMTLCIDVLFHMKVCQ